VRSDQTVILTAIESVKVYPDALRRVAYFDPENERRLKFLTNNFALPALTIAKIYKSRWMVELFFKFIKSHLRIKSFYGTSETAVKTQIWIAVSTYVLVAIIRKRLRLGLPGAPQIGQTFTRLIYRHSVQMGQGSVILELFPERMIPVRHTLATVRLSAHVTGLTAHKPCMGNIGHIKRLDR
jgi:transposase